ncbi:MFS transporter [Spirochaeta isovalerica]|uniref:Putative MFS family arabinose efflux permease n=1 Tax=Spirochaeta isovalerica TaxID=150 RepID=A0A841R763_9SPIO|nr:MFS transporter [Spirochaeta isovalerica]MBB6479673.1 putative MFS family arabinose efflux permease [Spirochaeta isovalerica]
MIKHKPVNHRISYLLSLSIIIKLIAETGSQIFNPFLTIIAAGAGISAVTLGSLVGARSLLGLVSPALGILSDKIGYRKVMQLSLTVSGSGLLLTGLSRTPLLFAAGLMLTGLGQAGFIPSIQAHTSSRLPYEKRAMGIGMLEYSWALAGIFGLMTAGLLIERFSWRVPFILIGAALLIAVLVLFTLPESEKPHHSPGDMKEERKLTALFHLGGNRRSAWGAIAVHGLLMFSSMHLMIIHGGWLIDEYSLTPALLGTVALIMGCTDLSASVSVSLFVDRFGKKRSVAMGLTGMIAGFLILPYFNIGIIAAVIGLVIPRTFFEFALVSNIALLSEQAPDRRGKILSLGSASTLIGMTAAASLGPLNYYGMGLRGLTLISMGTSAVALLVLLLFVKEIEPDQIS